MALSPRQADKVAREKQRASLAAGDSPAKAAKYAQEVRDYARRDREQATSSRTGTATDDEEDLRPHGRP